MNKPLCTYTDECIFRLRNEECDILTDMPKKRKSGICPFSKKHINDIGGKETRWNGQQKER